MTGRLTRLARRVGLDPLMSAGRKPRILPMTPEDERILAELNRRREARRRDRENRP